MIPIEHYILLYYVGLALLVFVAALQLSVYKNGDMIPNTVLHTFEVLFLGFVILYIGTRDPYASFKYLGDTGAYTRTFNKILSTDLSDAKDIGFYLFMKLMHPFGIKVFYLVSAALYVLLPYLTFKKWFGRYAIIASIVTIVSMSFFAFGINTMRNGLAVAIFLFGLGFFRSSKIMFIGLLWLSTVFHSSMFLPITALLFTYFLRNSKILIGIWLLTAVVAFFFGDAIERNLTALFKTFDLADNRAENLFTDEFKAIITRRYRLDFVLYSAVPIILGAYYQYKKNYKDPFYLWIYNTYIIANTYWLLMIYAAFTDRTAYLSWMLMPTVLVYPILKKRIFVNQYQYLAGLILISFIFTLIIAFK